MHPLVAFLVHLRVHYQLFVLSGGYLLGGLYAERPALPSFVLHFFVVHVLLNGGVTAYNSYWDDDDGPIGGVENPPKMAPWMHHAAIVVQLAGLPFAYRAGPVFSGLYVLTMLLSVAYSRKGPRWKGHPVLSLVAVGIGTGTNTFWMGALAAGRAFDVWLVIAGVGVALLLLSLYPVSQVFQIEEDEANGDRTFAVAYGLAGVRRWFATAYTVGLALVVATLVRVHVEIGIAVGVLGAIGGLVDARLLWSLRGEASEYRAVMRLKYTASLSFVVGVVVALALVINSGGT